MLAVDAPAEADRVFNALAENGAMQMPLQRTFFRCGSACSWINSAHRG
jgi:uncharacterized glyoxalase superfamily protein PhnB